MTGAGSLYRRVAPRSGPDSSSLDPVADLETGPLPQGILDLIGERALALHWPDPDARELFMGGDVDCIVDRLDPRWPLRLPAEWRLLQCLHHDLRAWTWVLARGEDVVWVDTAEDPHGIDREGFPTTPFLDSSGPVAAPAVRAAFLVTKRIRKGIRSDREWRRISTLASRDPVRFLDALEAAVGSRLSDVVGGDALLGTAPSAIAMRGAQLLLLARRFRSPGRVGTGIALGALRHVRRALGPSGLVVLVAGPDGSGKSTMASRLPRLCRGMFRGQARYHWRPGLLPRPGAVLGRAAPDPTTPHARSRYGRGVSAALALYYWLDFLIGELIEIRWLKWRTRLVVVERGWWDLAVDPARYRLDVPPWVVKGMGALLPKPDLALVLEGESQELARRKTEIDEPELARQMRAWRTALPAPVSIEFVDSSGGVEATERRIREAVMVFLEQRALRRLRPGWCALPPGKPARWLLPRAPREVANRAVDLFQPMTSRGRLGWHLSKAASALGVFRLLPQAAAPTAQVRSRLARHVPAQGYVAVGRTNHPGRFVAMIIPPAHARDGPRRVIAKVATHSDEEGGLRLEADSIERLGPLLAAPLYAPTVVAHEPGILVLEAEEWQPRQRSWYLDEDVALALGRFFGAGATGSGAGPAHGDFAPWNLLRTHRGWLLIDWEFALDEAPPLYDLFHHLVQAAVLLRRPSRRELLTALGRPSGWIGRAIAAYARGASREIPDPMPLFREYLGLSRDRMYMESPPPLIGIRFREALLKDLRE